MTFGIVVLTCDSEEVDFDICICYSKIGFVNEFWFCWEAGNIHLKR